MRPLLLAVALLTAGAPAHAAPGGAADGRIDISWADGSATVALQPGAAARDEAVALLRSARSRRPLRPELVQSGRLVALRSVRDSQRPCSAEGATVPMRREAGAIVQPLLPFYLDAPELDLLTGRGEIELDHVADNPGFPLPFAGEYFLPRPPTAMLRTSSPGCPRAATYDEEGNELSPAGTDEPIDRTAEVPVVSLRGDAVVPFGYALWLNEAQLPLRREGAVWRAALRGAEEGVTTAVALTLRGTPKQLDARCRVPFAKVERARTAAAAVAIARRAGFPGARYAGPRTRIGARRGRPFIDSGFTSSGYRECGLRSGPRIHTVR